MSTTTKATVVPSMAESIRRLAVDAMVHGNGLLVIGARQNFIGEFESCTKECLILKKACVAFDTGDLRQKEIAMQQSPPGGRIIIPIDKIDAVLAGKPSPKDADKV